MKHDTRDHLVSMTAIVAGAVVSVVVTIGSMIMSDERAPEVTPASIDQPTREVFVDPRGPDRGPTPVEWGVIQTYKTIESMTATEPSLDVVDRTLDELMSQAERYPENPYIQELYLKGLRVANYYAVAAQDEGRVSELEARFVDHAARFID